MKTNDEGLEQLTRDNVLSLDIATHTGYYSTHESGTWNFTESKSRNDNKLHGAFRQTLIDFIQRYNIKQVVAEDVNVNNHFSDMRRLSELRGILFEICDTLNLPEPKFVNVKTVKKWATGDGNADKKKMIDYCIKRWQITPIDDNAADATHIFFYYCRMYKL